MSTLVTLDYMADPPLQPFSILTAGDGLRTGLLYGVTNSVAGERLPSGTIAHKGIVLQNSADRLECVPVGRSRYRKFLEELARRQIRLAERGENAQ